MQLLIIDDNKADQAITAQYLEDAGGEYQFHHAYTAREGIELFKKHSIDCVLLDYYMPDQDGIEVLKQLTGEGRTTPIIMVTGEGNEFVAVTAMKLGSQDYIPKKTLSPAALKRAVERAVEHTQVLHKLEQYRNDLERSNQDLEQFATIVAHDLKSPLRAISQHLTLIKNKNADLLDEKSKRSLEFAVEGAERMRLLIDALFHYAQLGFTEPELSNVSLEAIVKNAMRDLSAVIEERGAHITRDVLPEVRGDAVLLSQLIQNLISNALKYCKDVPRIHISAEPEEHFWCIRVSDNGIGIPPSHHRQIFNIFRRLHQPEEYPGIGVGLAICERIVKQHGGAITVESEPGKGACFQFTLPTSKAIAITQRRAAHG